MDYKALYSSNSPTLTESRVKFIHTCQKRYYSTYLASMVLSCYISKKLGYFYSVTRKDESNF